CCSRSSEEVRAHLRLTSHRLRKSNVKSLDRPRDRRRGYRLILTLLFLTKSMKTHRRFTQIARLLRFGSGVALISAAAAMALVAIKPSSPSLATSQELQWT